LLYSRNFKIKGREILKKIKNEMHKFAMDLEGLG
jgi:hypothetical protein